MRMEYLLKTGMIGTGRIAHRFVPEAGCVEGIEVCMVYNPRKESAIQFAKETGILNWTTNLDELAEAVNAVYIATPHETHYTYAKEMLLRGIHVLCEKPMVFSKAQAEELFALAEEKHCILMEAIKTAYCPGFQTLVDLIGAGAIGKVYDVEACFSRLTPTNVREMTDMAYGGSFLELGTYTLLPIMKLLGTSEDKVEFYSVPAVNGIDGYTKAAFSYRNAIGTTKTGLTAKSEGELVIAGSRGYVVAQAPWWLTRHFEIRHEDPNQKEVFDFPYEGQGLRYEIQAFLDAVHSLTEETEKTVGKAAVVSHQGIRPEESIWLAEKMEQFLEYSGRNRKERKNTEKNAEKRVKIWAHRGCSLAYPENTLEAFRAAAEIPGITGIELDVQMSLDKELVVIHDETVDRTTDGTGRVCDYTLAELKRLKISGRDEKVSSIPTLEEVFTALAPVCKKEREEGKFLINIELKNSVIHYEGLEERVLGLVFEFGLTESIVFSSFDPESMGLIKEFYPKAKTGILGMSAEQCLEDAVKQQADAIHPWIGGLDLDGEELDRIRNMPVRAWNMEEPFFGQDRMLREQHMDKYAMFGATDIITNVPELYLR